MTLSLDHTITLHERRCGDCGQWWASEEPDRGICPSCAIQRIVAAARMEGDLKAAREGTDMYFKRSISAEKAHFAWRDRFKALAALTDELLEARRESDAAMRRFSEAEYAKTVPRVKLAFQRLQDARDKSLQESSS